MSRLRVPILLAVIAIASAAFPAVQSLPEAHALSATFTVTKVADTNDGTCDADCSLREAITAANANGNPTEQDVIEFAIPGAGPHVISVATALPTVAQAVHIKGEAQPGASCDLADRSIRIELRGAATGFGGLFVSYVGTPGSTVSGLAVTGFGTYGVRIASPTIRIRCNNFGVEADGVTARGNVYGIILIGGPSSVIGGQNPSDRNLISASPSTGMSVEFSANSTIRNNYFGLNQGGTAVLANTFFNVFSNSSPGLEIRENVFTGTVTTTSVLVQGASSNGTIQGNLIGYLPNGITSTSGSAAVRIEAADGFTSSGHTVGGVGAGEANRIYVTGTAAVEVKVFGTGVTTNNVIRGNTIRAGSMGIALSPVGETNSQVTSNDAQDVDAGPNHLQNFPVLTAVDIGGTVAGDLNSTPSSTFFVDFYAGPGCTGRDGERYLGSKTVVTGVDGDVSFTATGLGTFAFNESVTATATDANGNTSEFSSCILPPARSLTGINPTEAIAGSADTLVTVTGVSLAASDVVTWAGQPVATTYVNSTTLQFTATSAMKLATATRNIQVVGATGSTPFLVTRSSSDVDCSGVADAGDAGFLLRVLAGLESEDPDCPADANQLGGDANIADVLHIRMDVAGLVQPLKSLFQ